MIQILQFCSWSRPLTPKGTPEVSTPWGFSVSQKFGWFLGWAIFSTLKIFSTQKWNQAINSKKTLRIFFPQKNFQASKSPKNPIENRLWVPPTVQTSGRAEAQGISTSASCSCRFFGRLKMTTPDPQDGSVYWDDVFGTHDMIQFHQSLDIFCYCRLDLLL